MIPEPAQPDAPPIEPGEGPRPLEPVAEKDRILAIDALRGFALFGILVVNIQFFALPFGQAIMDPGLATAPLIERAVAAFISVLFLSKFFSLFSLLFGIGLVIQSHRAAQRQQPFVGTYLRRLSVLAVFGLVHAFVLWYGDILFIYAVAGLLLLPAPRMSGRALVITGASLLALTSVLVLGCISLQVYSVEFQPPPPPETVEVAAGGAGGAGSGPISVDEMVETLNAAQWNLMSEPFMQAETRAYGSGGAGAAFLVRAISTVASFVFTTLGGFGLHVVAMFYIGAGLMKLRFFGRDRWSAQVWMAAIGLVVGLGLEAISYAIQVASGHVFGPRMIAASFIHEWGSVLLCLGYVGAITALVNSGRLGVLWRGLGRVGRLALTVYLSETILATTLMYWWGFGLFGQVSRLEMMGIVVAIYAVLVVFSQLWLIPFRIGPAEWLWRCLTYLRVQPLRRIPPRE